MKNKISLWQKFKNGLFTKAQVLTGVTISLMVSSALVWAFSITSLNVFTSGGTISSSEVNDNFTYVKERLDKLAGDKFTVNVSTQINVGTFASNNASVLNVADFDTVDSDFSTGGIGTTFITQDYIVVDESTFYEASIVAKVTAASSNHGYVHVAKKAPGAADFSSMGNLYLSTTDTIAKGVRVTEFLNSGSSVQIRVGADKYSGLGANTMDIESGLIFSLKKL